MIDKNESLVIPELNGAKIRKTDDGRFSVYDLIRIAGSKGERKVWERLCIAYPELVTKCHAEYLGQGKARKKTPVATLEDCLYILGLLPGECGKSYREKAANLVRRYIEGDADLGAEIIARDGDRERQKRALRRLNVVETNKAAADVVYDTGYPIGQMHDDRYRGLYQKNTKQLREDCGAKPKETPLNYMSERDLAYNYAVNLMVIESGDPNKAFEGGRGMADLHERITGKKLSPEWKDSCLNPNTARELLGE